LKGSFSAHVNMLIVALDQSCFSGKGWFAEEITIYFRGQLANEQTTTAPVRALALGARAKHHGEARSGPRVSCTTRK
jgi:hypothetical protein